MKATPMIFRLLITLAALLLGATPAYANNFLPGETPPALTASTTSSSMQFTLAVSANQSDVMACNAGNVIAFVGCGPSTVTANVPAAGAVNATPVLPMNCTIFYKGQATYCAGITASSSTTLYFTAGQGD